MHDVYSPASNLPIHLNLNMQQYSQLSLNYLNVPPGCEWPPIGAGQAVGMEQARQIAAEAMAASGNNAAEALAKLLALALRID